MSLEMPPQKNYPSLPEVSGWRKNPAPDIYLLAAKNLGIPPQNCVAIEDSRNGLLSAHSAGLQVLVTTSWFTKAENFAEAWLVVSALGDPGGEQTVVSQNRIGHSVGTYVQLDDIAAVGG